LYPVSRGDLYGGWKKKSLFAPKRDVTKVGDGGTWRRHAKEVDWSREVDWSSGILIPTPSPRAGAAPHGR
jgi:hypothetical protein